MRYLTYEEYQKMGGTLEQGEFSQFATEAEAEIDFYTDRKLVLDTVIPTEVKNLVFVLVDLVKKKSSYGNTENGIVSSVSNDGVSVSYAAQTAQQFLDGYNDNIKEMIVKYLFGIRNEAGKPLLYRGW